MKKINLAVIGASGKMGQALRDCYDPKKYNLFLAISSKKCEDFQFSFEKISNIDSKIKKSVDVWIDFTSAEGLKNLLQDLKKDKIRLVSGSTGISKKDFRDLIKLSKKSAVFWSSNMSPGLWALRQAMTKLNLIRHFSVSIEETHHLQKKDNPSGTSITLHQDLEKIFKKKIKNPIGHRKENVFGEHIIQLESDSETIQLKHIAKNRTVFAQGALKAASFLVKKARGFYSMKDL